MAYPKIKICCISSIEEAKLALKLGASALGLVGEMPSGPGIIPSHLIKKIIKTIPPDTNTFLLTSQQNIEDIIREYQELQPHTIQIVDELTSGTLQTLKAVIPSAQLIQVIHVLGEESIDYAVQQSQYADALLLDSGNPNLSVKTLGGTGETHNWDISRKIVEAVDKPVWLAGGLKASNVRSAIEVVQPYGVDLCSGVRTAGKLDAIKLSDFVSAVRGPS